MGLTMPEIIGWSSALILLPAFGLQTYRQWQNRHEPANPSAVWFFVLVLVGTGGQVAYSWLVRNWVYLALNSALVVNNGVGLGIALWRRKTVESDRTNDGASARKSDDPASAASPAMPLEVGHSELGGPLNMIPDDDDEQQGSDPANGSPEESPPPDAHRDVVATTDPAVAVGRVGDRPEGVRPDETTVAETSHVTGTTGYAGPPQVGPSGGEKSREVGRKGRDEDPSKGQDGDHRGGRSRPAESNRSSWVRYALTGVVALVCGVGGAWAYSHFASSKDKDQSEGNDQAKQTKKADDGASSKKGSSDSQARGNDEASSGGSGSMSPSEVPAGSADNLSNQVRNLSAGFETLRQRLETMSMPRDTNSPDLASLRIRMDELSRKVDDVKDLPSRNREMDGRLDRLQGEVKGLRDQLVADRERGGHDASSPITAAPRPKIEAPAVPVPPVNPSSPDEALVAGIVLFKQGKYTQAEAIFRILQQTKPQDARVWYFSALATGLATGQWEGESRSFVMQGAERERSGLPATSVIDTALTGLSTASGKDWLASYRSQLVR